MAAWLARVVAARERCDGPAVEAAALLHDVDKTLPASDPARRLRHGAGSAEWLARRGHPELAPLVADHSVTRLLAAGWEEWLPTASIEAAIVSYADKRAGQRLQPMADRFADWAKRYDEDSGWSVAQRELAWRRAVELEAHVCRAAGIAPASVRRLRWTASALRAASHPVAA